MVFRGDQREIPDADIARAVLHSSMMVYCNIDQQSVDNSVAQSQSIGMIIDCQKSSPAL